MQVGKSSDMSRHAMRCCANLFCFWHFLTFESLASHPNYDTLRRTPPGRKPRHHRSTKLGIFKGAPLVFFVCKAKETTPCTNNALIMFKISDCFLVLLLELHNFAKHNLEQQRCCGSQPLSPRIVPSRLGICLRARLFFALSLEFTLFGCRFSLEDCNLVIRLVLEFAQRLPRQGDSQHDKHSGWVCLESGFPKIMTVCRTKKLCWISSPPRNALSQWILPTI